MNESKGSNKPAPECLVIDDEESDIEIIPEEPFKRYQHISRTQEHSKSEGVENSDMDESGDEDASYRVHSRSRFNYVLSDESDENEEEEEDEELEEEEQDDEDENQHDYDEEEHTGKASTANDTMDVTMAVDNINSPNASTPMSPPEALGSKPQVAATPLGCVP